MIDKKKIIEDLIQMLQPKINKALIQTAPQNRKDLKQNLYEKISRKIYQEKLEELPGIFEIESNY